MKTNKNPLFIGAILTLLNAAIMLVFMWLLNDFHLTARQVAVVTIGCAISQYFIFRINKRANETVKAEVKKAHRSIPCHEP